MPVARGVEVWEAIVVASSPATIDVMDPQRSSKLSDFGTSIGRITILEV